MEDLTPEQYESVLKYMETTNQENFQLATQALQQHDFNLQHAVQSRFNPAPSRSSRSGRSSRANSGQSDQQIIRRYVQYMQRKNAQWSILSATFNFVKTIILTILGLLTRVLPYSIRTKFFGSDFEKIYLGKLPPTFTSRSLPSLLLQTKNVSSKCVLMLVSPRKSHSDIVAFLSKNDLQKPITRNFLLTGHSQSHSQLSQIQHIDAPMLIALRYNIFDELVEVGRTRQINGIDSTFLDRWAHEGRNLFKRDCNVVIKYRNLINRAFGVGYQEEEEEEVNLLEAQNNSQQIQQQNRLYREMEEQAMKNKEKEARRAEKQEEEKRKKQEYEAERQLRKSSIPTEPTEGSIVRFSFRCPDGKTIFRNFSSDQNLDLVFQWVELNDEIEFQDEKRSFEIMYNYPPQPLSSQKHKPLSQIFDGSQQKLVIRQL